jgi:hypothetical protein
MKKSINTVSFYIQQQNSEKIITRMRDEIPKPGEVVVLDGVEYRVKSVDCFNYVTGSDVILEVVK